MTVDLVEFLRARLADRLENADSIHDLGCGSIRYDGTCDCGEPEVVRAEVDAQRRIIEQYEEQAGIVNDSLPEWSKDQWSSHADQWRVGVAEGLEIALKALALPYASDPDYREEWKP